MKDWQRFTGSSLKRWKYWMRKQNSKVNKQKAIEKLLNEEVKEVLNYEKNY